MPHAGAMDAMAGDDGKRRRQLRAVALMLACVGVFSLMDVVLKTLSAHYSPFQVASLRGAASLPFLLAWAAMTTGLRPLLRARWPLHLLRGALGILMMAAFVYALRTLPLSTAYAIFFVAPLLITALSVPFLREHVGPRRWIAITIGFAGVLVVLRPGSGGVASAAGVAVLLAAFGYAVSAITVRVLARTDSTQAMVLWLMVLMAVGAGALALPAWQPIRAEHAWLILVLGVAGSFGQVLITEAFRLGEASLLAPLEYTALVWGVLWDATLWGVLPDGATWLGAGIIIASGLYLVRREGARASVTPPP